LGVGVTSPAMTMSGAAPGRASGATTDVSRPRPTIANPSTGSQVIQAASTTGLTTLTTAAAPGQFTVIIRAREESWVEIAADGKALPSELLPAGSARTIQGQKKVVVKAGNAGGVDFQVNGKRIDTGAQYGQVKTVAFGPGGILPVPPSAP
jgi:hypothetical protein